MRGDVRAPPEEVSVRSVGGAGSYSHWKIEYQKVVNNSQDESTLVKASTVWKDAQNLLEGTMLGKEVGRTSKGLVGMRPITIVVTTGSIYRESRIMPE